MARRFTPLVAFSLFSLVFGGCLHPSAMDEEDEQRLKYDSYYDQVEPAYDSTSSRHESGSGFHGKKYDLRKMQKQ